MAQKHNAGSLLLIVTSQHDSMNGILEHQEHQDCSTQTLQLQCDLGLKWSHTMTSTSMRVIGHDGHMCRQKTHERRIFITGQNREILNQIFSRYTKGK
jgi:hypothetical protein